MDDQTRREENIGKGIMGVFAVFAALGMVVFLSIIPGLLPFIGVTAIVAFVMTQCLGKKEKKVKKSKKDEVEVEVEDVEVN